MHRSVRVLLFGLLAMGMVASNAGATALDPLQLVEDPALDHLLFEQVDGDATPPAMDLKAGYIAETPDTVDFVWEFYDIPDGSGGLFEGNISYWEFALDDNDGIVDPVLFSLRARATWPFGFGVHVHCNIPGVPIVGTCQGVGPGGAQIASNCTTTGAVVSCSVVPGSLVTVTVDDIANKMTAKVRRLDLRDADNNFIATDGSILTEMKLFRGIASCAQIVIGALAPCDEGDMTLNVDEDSGGYILGTPRS